MNALIFSQGIAMGLYATAFPGPFQAFLLSQTLRIGWRRTLPAAFGPLFSDGPVITVVLLLLARLPLWTLDGLRTAGGLFLLFLAWGAFSAVRQVNIDARPPTAEGRESLVKAVLMNLLNPNIYIFWSTIGGPIVLEGWKTSAAHGWSFIAGMYGAMIPATAALIVLFGATGRLAGRGRKWLQITLAVLMVAIGTYQIWQGVGGLLSHF
jgi:threonine/homoserine/homoserine lactone efflux protein